MLPLFSDYPSTSEIDTLSLHDALPICRGSGPRGAVGRRTRGWVVPGGLPARRHVGDRGGAVRGSRVRGGADVGGLHAQRIVGLRVPVRVLARHDRAAGRSGTVLRYGHGAAAVGRLDGMDQEGRRCGVAGHGRVLLRSSGDGVVMRYVWLAGVALAAGVARLGAQDVGLAVGTKAPVVAVEDLDGKPVDLGQYIGRQPMVLEFWATWCPLCKALEPSLKAAHARYGRTVRFLAIGVGVNQSPASIKRHLTEHPLP